MNTKTYYVMKPTTSSRKKVSYGDELELTEAQARPLRHGGFITIDKAAADRIGELIRENQLLKEQCEDPLNIEPKLEAEKSTSKTKGATQ